MPVESGYPDTTFYSLMNKTDLVETNGTVSFHWAYQFSGLCVASVHSERSEFARVHAEISC